MPWKFLFNLNESERGKKQKINKNKHKHSHSWTSLTKRLKHIKNFIHINVANKRIFDFGHVSVSLFYFIWVFSVRELGMRGCCFVSVFVSFFFSVGWWSFPNFYFCSSHFYRLIYLNGCISHVLHLQSHYFTIVN